MGKRARSPLAGALLALVATPSAGIAFPMSSLGTEAFRIIVNGVNPVIAEYRGSSGSYVSDLYLMLDEHGNPGDDGDYTNDRFIFNNHESHVGSLVDLGSFDDGTELSFRLYVHDTDTNYFAGSGFKNPGGNGRAGFRGGWTPGGSLLSFEHPQGTPEGPRGYSGVAFSLWNTRTEPRETTEPPVLALLVAGLVGLGVMRRLQNR